MLRKLIDNYGLENLVVLEQEGTKQVNSRGIRMIQELVGLDHERWPKGFHTAVEDDSGKFATRLAGYFAALGPGPLDNKTKAAVGLIAESNSTPAERVYLDLTHDIMTWQPGSFRDNRSNGQLGEGTTISCFRQGHKYSIDHLKELGAVTMRLFRPGGNPLGRNFYGNLNGAGRAFLIPYRGRIIIANYYGLGGDGNKFAAIVLEMFKRLDIPATYYLAGSTRGHGQEMAGIYINGSGLYVVGEPNKKQLHIDEIRFKPAHIYTSGQCRCCSRWFTHQEENNEHVAFCQDCGARCYDCSREYVYSLLTWVSDKGIWMCNRCSSDAMLSINPCGSVTSDLCECGECDV